MKKILERIITATPIDGTAARVTDRRDAEVWTPKLSEYDRVFDAPPPLRSEITGSTDLTGIRAGRLVVIGLSATKSHIKAGGNSHAPAKWVCRCVCGKYTFRSAKAIRKASERREGDEDRCAACRVLARVKRQYDKLPPRDFKNVKTEVIVEE